MTADPGSPRGLAQPVAPLGEDLSQVRAWARSRGFPVDEAGEVPASVLQTYRQVHRPVLRLTA